jgi:hypothetical protein
VAGGVLPVGAVGPGVGAPVVFAVGFEVDRLVGVVVGAGLGLSVALTVGGGESTQMGTDKMGRENK